MVLLLTPTFKFKLNMKNVILAICVISLVAFFTYTKIDLYFLSGGEGLGANEDIQDAVARAALYYHMPDILLDYFPFGSGFASYASFASGVYYSPLYAEYGMDNIYGMTKNYYPFEL